MWYVFHMFAVQFVQRSCNEGSGKYLGLRAQVDNIGTTQHQSSSALKTAEICRRVDVGQWTPIRLTTSAGGASPSLPVEPSALPLAHLRTVCMLLAGSCRDLLNSHITDEHTGGTDFGTPDHVRCTALHFSKTEDGVSFKRSKGSQALTLTCKTVLNLRTRIQSLSRSLGSLFSRPC
jgi:hypothetical protein